jgi:integrase/recombinase XerD
VDVKSTVLRHEQHAKTTPPGAGVVYFAVVRGLLTVALYKGALVVSMARMNGRLDIHNYEAKYAQAERQVAESEISARNKELILGYRDACLLHQTCRKVRLIRVLGALLLFARQFNKDFDQVSRDDVQRIVTGFLNRNPPYSAETLGTYKAILRRFFTWISNPEAFPNVEQAPATVAWIRTTVFKRDKMKLERNDLLTPEDIENLLAVCHNPRDKALIAVLWETGGRIAEVGNLQLKHVVKTQHGYTLDLTGKTGSRNPLIISSAPYVSQWLSLHPFKDNPESPLWVHYQYGKKAEQLRYDSIRYLLTRHFSRANIQKPFHPHLFRHSRATYVLANAVMNESQAKAYFGWTPDSDMLATYSHLIDQDSNNAILRENGLTPQQQRQDELKPVTCRICAELNPPKADYCVKCGAVLDLTKAYEHQKVHDLKEELFVNLFKILVEKGLVDEAAKEVHEAGLGMTLKRLAQHISQEKHIAEP